jgi:hypothetical protein
MLISEVPTKTSGLQETDHKGNAARESKDHGEKLSMMSHKDIEFVWRTA